MGATVHYLPTRNGRPYIVTISENRKHTRIVRIANSWSECWMSVVNEFGKAAVSCVRPVK